jgi:cytoskeletal protein CcmA (bactofilin family)
VDSNQTIISKDTFFKGEISAASITIEGKVIGTLEATESILVKEDGWVEGDISAPNVYLAKGCYHEGNIYIDYLENASSAKIHMDRLELKSDDQDVATTNESKNPKEQPASESTKSKAL